MNPDLVFPSPLKLGAAMSDMTLTEGAAVRRSGGSCNGPRVPQQLQELDAGADGHPLGGLGGGPCPTPSATPPSKPTLSSDLFERRRTLMQLWADYVSG